VTARLTTSDAGAAPDRATIEARFRDDGLSPHGWGNAPGDQYGRHAHDYDKILYCVSGGITFHTDAGDLTLKPGDRLEVDAGTSHSATVGPEGVECLEASR
jgi:quercetin dioxygenase-like cupin family protein